MGLETMVVVKVTLQRLSGSARVLPVVSQHSQSKENEGKWVSSYFFLCLALLVAVAGRVVEPVPHADPAVRTTNKLHHIRISEPAGGRWYV